MGLVDYNSSEEEEEEEVRNDGRRNAPSLPNKFYNIFSSRPRIGDDPELHEGLSRSISHREGMWPSHVYIEWVPDRIQRALIERLVAGIPGDTTSLVRDRLGAYQPLHISLSPTLMVPTELKSGFYEALLTALRSKPCFNVTFREQLCWLPNPENTRLFAALSLNQGDIKVSEIIQMVSSICSQIGVYYQQQLLTHGHVSIAWCKPPRPLGSMPSNTDDDSNLCIHVNQVKLRMGNQIKSFRLVDN